MTSKYKKIALGILLSLQAAQATASSDALVALGMGLTAIGSTYWASTGISKYGDPGMLTVFVALFKTALPPLVVGSLLDLVLTSKEERILKAKKWHELKKRWARQSIERLSLSLQELPLWKAFDESDFTSWQEVVCFSMEQFLYEKYPLITFVKELRTIKKHIEGLVKTLHDKDSLIDKDEYKKYIKTTVNLEAYLEKIDRYVLLIKTSAEYHMQFSVYQSEENVKRVSNSWYIADTSFE